MKILRAIPIIIFFIIIDLSPPFDHFETIPISVKKVTEWDKLIMAIIWVESNNIDTIKGQNGSLGCLQITPIYVREVNHILKDSGYNIQYTLEDRKNREKCIQMFNIMNTKYNPKKNISKAIKIHNPNSPKSYYEKIKNYMKKLTNL